jgi:hypothetical protein
VTIRMTVVLSRVKCSLKLISYRSPRAWLGQWMLSSMRMVGLGKLKCRKMKLGSFKLEWWEK